MTPIETLTLAVYFFVLVILAVYGWHRYYLVYLYMKHKDHPPTPKGSFEALPRVTVQLPIYNEMYVAERLIGAVCKLDYPRELLEIQVLDDSVDETTAVAERAVRRHAAAGVNITYLHRSDRTGYKAGALEAGLHVAQGEFVAVFDADFIPTADFLLRSVQFFTDPKVAMVQARWGHINQDYSLLTKIQSILLDGHFVLEHGSRSRAGLCFNFNGTAGIWRRSAIIDAGGWQHDTLTEDLDLSYRAQLRGWRFVFLQDLVAPAEVPVEMNAFKSQQHRWAKGSIQTCRKLLPRILRSDLPLRVKAEACFHLTANFNYLLMCVLSVLMAPAMVIRYNMGWYEMLLIDVPLFFAATASVANFYMVCQRELHADWTTRLKYLPFLMSIGIGLTINNTRAVLEALFNQQSEFARTPKYCIEGQSDEWVSKKYREGSVIQPMIELTLGLYFTATVFYALANGIYGTVPFLVLFQVGFLYTSLLSIVQQFSGGDVLLGAGRSLGRVPRQGASPWQPQQRQGGGLEDVVATSSAICYLDGDRGVLAYCGYDIHDLATSTTFEEVCYLLWHRRLPTRAELGDLQSQLAAARPLPQAVVRMMRSLPPGDAMDALRTLSSALSHYDPEVADVSPAAQYRKAVRLTARVSTLVATWGGSRLAVVPSIRTR